MQPASDLHPESSPRLFDVFFYGLFMDAEVLAERGVVPRLPRLAFIEDHSVRLESKATLQRATGKRAYGVLFRLTHDEMDTLYSSMNDYAAEAFLAMPVAGNHCAGPVAAISMVHREPPQKGPGGGDSDYGRRWKILAQKLGIPMEPESGTAHVVPQRC